MSITIQNLRIIPYGQKDTLKPVFGDTMHLTFRLADAPMEGDRYLLGLDYERILFPTMRPLCAMATEYTAAGTDVSFDLKINTERFALWASMLKKPTPIWLQLVRVRGEEYTTILLDDILALPSVVDGANMVFPGTPLEDKLAKKLDKPTEAGQAGNVLKLGEDGKPIWGEGEGGGSAQQATDAEIDARESTTHTITPNNLDYAVRSVLPNVTTIPSATTAYSLLDASATTNNHSWQYFHAPAAASTYVFPAVTDDSVAHRIKLTIDFAAVQTYSFEDAEGNALTPLFTPTISAGDVYEFDCEYSAVKSQWLVWPHKQGAVSDDYVMQSQVGAANGAAGLDSEGLVPATQLPKASKSQHRLGIIEPSLGLATDNSGGLYVSGASTQSIDDRGGSSNYNYIPLCIAKLNYAVAAALTDAKKIQLTDAQKASAQDTLGIATPLIGTTAPTTSTAGSVGQLYVDTTTSKTYHCTAVANTGTEEEPVWSYTWVDDINAKGGTFAGDICIDHGLRVVKWIDIGGNNHSVVDGGYVCIGRANTGGRWYSLLVGNTCTVNGRSYVVLFGNHLKAGQDNTVIMGKYNIPIEAPLTVGGGTADNMRSNALELSWTGDLYIAGGHQQGVTTIPSATTAYTLAEGVQSHIPDSASTYTLPAIQLRIIADGRYFTRNPATDGTGYYGWLSGTTNRYTSSAAPAVGDNTYTNTGLSSGAKAITAIDERTHECILTVRFSATVLTYAFEDASGNPITPLPLAGTIADGSVVAFRCTWEALLGQWVIEPKLLNPNA